MKIAYIGYDNSGNKNIATTSDEHILLFNFLQSKGLNLHQVIWSDKNIEWDSFDLILFKYPWDYSERKTEFIAWLDHIELLNIKTLNSVELIKWNMHKSYLSEISKSGLGVIPTIFVKKTEKVDLSIFSKLKTDKIVVKPAVSAGARDTRVINWDSNADILKSVNEDLKYEDYLIQPFEKDIINGECSLIYLGGKYSHAVLKVPKEKDFRVQHHHGAETKAITAPDWLVKATAGYIREYASDTLYARVDGIIKDGKFLLMELELIEPYLYLDKDQNAFNNYYNALKEKLSEM